MYAHLDEKDTAADYRQLLRRGSVLRRLAPAQHAAWRRAIRAAARADELTVRTWSREGAPGQVWAVLQGMSLTPAERERLQLRLTWLRED